MIKILISVYIFFHLRHALSSAIPLTAIANHPPSDAVPAQQVPQAASQPQPAPILNPIPSHISYAVPSVSPGGYPNANPQVAPQAPVAPAAPVAATVPDPSNAVKPGEHFPAVPAPQFADIHAALAGQYVANNAHAAQVAPQPAQSHQQPESTAETGLVAVTQPTQLSSNEAADPAVMKLRRINYSIQQAEQDDRLRQQEQDDRFRQQQMMSTSPFPQPGMPANPQIHPGAGQYQVWDDMQSSDYQMSQVRQNTGNPWHQPFLPPSPPQFGPSDPGMPPPLSQHQMPFPPSFPTHPPPPYLPPLQAPLPPPPLPPFPHHGSTMFPPPNHFPSSPYPMGPPPLMGFPPPPPPHMPVTFKPATTTSAPGSKGPQWMQLLSKIDLNREDGLYTQEEIDLKKALYYAARAVEL